jgi:toxin ParE1/3/4
MRYRVELTAQAEAEIDRIFTWLSERSQDAANRWYESFWNSAERLQTFPRSCGVAPENAKFGVELRQILFGTKRGRTYRALFVISDDVVRILCVRGPGERPLQSGDVTT